MIAPRHRAGTSERRLSDPSASRAVLIESHAFTRGGARGRDRRSHLEDRPSVEAGCLRLAELLKDPTVWGLPGENCVVVPQPTREDMLSAVDKAAAKATDTLLVYYAGHGLLYPLSGDLHLAVPETTKDKSYTAVKYEDLREILLSATRIRRKVVILDCCFSGTALRGTLSTDDAAVRLAGVEGASVLTASHATKQALAPPGENYPAFTGELIALLEEGDPEKPELLSMADIFDRVDQSLLHKGRPRPQQLNRDNGAHICIAHNRAAPPEPPPEPPPEKGELREASESAGGSGDAGDGEQAAGRKAAPPEPVSPAVGLGCVTLVLVVVWVLAAGFMSLLTTDLLYAGEGRKPAEVTAEPGSVDGQAYVWDVESEMHSTFRAEDDAEVKELRGELTVTVPDGCTDRSVRWQLVADGRTVGQGTLHGKQEYAPFRGDDVDHAFRDITLTTSWDGGTKECDSYSVLWSGPRLLRRFDLFPF